MFMWKNLLVTQLPKSILCIKQFKNMEKLCRSASGKEVSLILLMRLTYVKSGKLGRIRTCKAWSYVDWKGAVPKVADSPVPEGVNYDLWLGPAPKTSF